MPLTRRLITAAATGTLTAGLLLAPSTAHATPAPAAAPVPQSAPVPSTAPLPATFHTAPRAWATIRLGDRGATVTALQRVVDIQADGVFGPHTFQAVTAWQRSHHLVADGVVGPLTAAAMKLTGSGSVPTPQTTPKWEGHNVGYGDRGGLVPLIQAIVGVPAYGSFDWATVLAVKKFQGSHRLGRDGVVGPLTAYAMRLPGAPTPPPSGEPTPAASRILAIAEQYTGIPYLWGGDTTAGFDCSGYTQFVFAKSGKSLPHNAARQQGESTVRVTVPRPGDLVFYGFPAHHVGIYAGNGSFYDAGHAGLLTQKRRMWAGPISYGRVV